MKEGRMMMYLLTCLDREENEGVGEGGLREREGDRGLFSPNSPRCH
jgi:hypothetical protein